MNILGINKVTRLMTVIILTITFNSCSRTQFRNIAEAPKTSFATEPGPDIPLDPGPPIIVEPPVEAPPIETPPVVPPVIPPIEPELPPIAQPIQKAGLCKNDSSTQLLTCMNCAIPLNPPLPPQLSEKGNSLLEIMTIGCSIFNKSEPKGYLAPTRDELLKRMNRLSPILYPDSKMTEAQKKVVYGLKTDVKLQQKMFGGLWYQPPYSDHLETYFGISTGEAVNYICYSRTAVTPTSDRPLMSKDFIDCFTNTAPFTCKEKREYVIANKYRDQLNNGMKESLRSPYVPPTPTPAKNCNWETFEGEYDLGGEEVLARWLISKFKVGMEIGNLGGKCEMINDIPVGANKPRGQVKMAAYICK